jgi:hypothetical protein
VLLVDVVEPVILPSYKKLQICSGRCEEMQEQEDASEAKAGTGGWSDIPRVELRP